MIAVTHTDPYTTDPKTGGPATVTRYGIGVATGRRSFGRQPDGTPTRDEHGNDGKDTVDVVMLDTGARETYDTDAVNVLDAEGKPTPAAPPAPAPAK